MKRQSGYHNVELEQIDSMISQHFSTTGMGTTTPHNHEMRGS